VKKISVSLFVALSTLLLGCETNIYNTPPTPAAPTPTATVSADAGSAVTSDTAPAIVSDTAPTIVLDSGVAMDAEIVVDTDRTIIVLDSGSTQDALLVTVDARAMDTLPADTTAVVADAEPITDDAQASEAGIGSDSLAAQPPCKLAWSGKISDGVGGRVATTKNGFGVTWFGQESYGNIVNFQSFDWSGAPIADAVSLINFSGFVGGNDGYLALFYDNTGMAMEWSVYKLGADGKLGSKIYVVADQNKSSGMVPFLSFDGKYFRVTFVMPGQDVNCKSGATVSTGLIASSGYFLQDNYSSCVPVDPNGLSVTSVADDGNSKPVVLLYSWNNQATNETMYIINYQANAFSALFAGDNTRRATQALYSKESGYLLSWNQTGMGGGYFLSPITADMSIVSAYQMPAGFIPSVISGNEVASVTYDQLSGARNVVKVTTGGKETARVALAPSKSQCSQNLVGNGSAYMVLDGGCFGGNNQSVVEAAVVTCN
jgi:hypothetical protein